MLPTLASALSFRTWLYFHHAIIPNHFSPTALLIYPSARTRSEGRRSERTFGLTTIGHSHTRRRPELRVFNYNHASNFSFRTSFRTWLYFTPLSFRTHSSPTAT